MTPDRVVKDQDKELFDRAMSTSQEPVVTILRVHLLTEYYIERLIHLILSRGDRVLDEANLSYYQKLVLASSFNLLNDKIVQSLRNLNKIRNQCSHEMDKSLTLTDVEFIARPFGSVCTRYRRDSKGSVPVFLQMTLGYVCGYLTGQIAAAEEIRIGKDEDSDMHRSVPKPNKTTPQQNSPTRSGTRRKKR